MAGRGDDLKVLEHLRRIATIELAQSIAAV